MPTYRNTKYIIRAYGDHDLRGQSADFREGPTTYVGQTLNDRVYGFEVLLPSGADEDDRIDFEHLLRHPERVSLVAYQDGGFGGQTFDLGVYDGGGWPGVAGWHNRAGRMIAPEVGQAAVVAGLSSFRASIRPMPEAEFLAVTAQRKKEADAVAAQQQQTAREEAARAAAAAPMPALELTVYQGGSAIWAAKDGLESSDFDGPHPGIEVAGMDWKQVSPDKTPQQLGLPRALLAWDGGRIVPARQEYSSIRSAARKGSRGAQQALYDLGVGPPPAPPVPPNPLAGLFGALGGF